MLFFFFKQKTAYEMRISDWSSDVCSSDLYPLTAGGHRRQGAAFGRTVKLGNDQAGKVDGGIERAYLQNGVLPGIAVYHQQHLVGRGRIGLAYHPVDFLALFTEVQLRGQATGGFFLAAHALPGPSALDGIERSEDGGEGNRWVITVKIS